jgi:hypothetical protein
MKGGVGRTVRDVASQIGEEERSFEIHLSFLRLDLQTHAVQLCLEDNIGRGRLASGTLRRQRVGN